MPPYVPHTAPDVRRMLDTVGVPDLDALFADIPAEVRLHRALSLPEGLSEFELTERLTRLSERGMQAVRAVSFLGAGTYDHVVPAALDAIVSRQEFFTAYTPYQPEISQGTLQALFEYQTMICSLTGLPASNASLYDASSAWIEAVRMAAGQTRRSRVLVSGGVHPRAAVAMRTALEPVGIVVDTVPLRAGRTDPDALGAMLANSSSPVAAVLVQSPNFLGYVEDIALYSGLAREAGALTVQGIMDALSLAVLRAPGDSGADIAAGSGQAFGCGLSFGGPAFGFITASDKLLRRLPGRIVGQSVDAEGRRAFVLTLQAREQHIRREKANSNICSNHSLYALRAAAYLALVGPAGLRRIAEDCMRKARLLEAALLRTGLFERITDAPFFREFTLAYRGDPRAFQRSMRSRGYLAGFDLSRLVGRDNPACPGGGMVFCTTEKTSDSDIGRFADAVEAFAAVRPQTGGPV